MDLNDFIIRVMSSTLFGLASAGAFVKVITPGELMIITASILLIYAVRY